VLESCSNPQDSASLLVYNEKILGFEFFVGEVISGIDFLPFWLRLPDPGPQPVDGNF